MSDWTEAGHVSAIAEGEFVVVDIDDVNIAVFNIDGDFYAMEDLCTHEHECLTGGKIDGHKIMCPRHGAWFDIKTGEALNPPAYEPAPVFPVRVENGRVFVRDDRWD